MGKASNAKKVNRAAATGGGRTGGRQAPVMWYGVIFVVVAIGATLVFLSSKQISDSQAGASTVAPVKNKDHWHAAYGFNLCGKWAAPLKDAAGDTTGIHTHEDGLVHTHPFVASTAGKNATFGKFVDDTGISLTSTSLDLKRPDEKFKNGNKCGKKPAELTARVFKNLKDTKGEAFNGDPKNIRLRNGELIVISFNPKGFKITQPPSRSDLSTPSDLAPPTTVAPEAQPQETPTSAAG
jgi:hypothetical protein